MNRVEVEIQTDESWLQQSVPTPTTTPQKPILSKTPSPASSLGSSGRRSAAKNVSFKKFFSNADDEEEPQNKKRKFNDDNDTIDDEADGDTDYLYDPTKDPIRRDEDRGVSTVVPVHSIALLMDRISQTEVYRQKQTEIDTYGIQTCLLNCAMDLHSFQHEDQIFNFIIENLDRFKIQKATQFLNSLPKNSYHEEQDQKVIAYYDQLMDSDAMKLQRSYRSDSELMREWKDDEEWKWFEEAYALFPDSSTSNRKIAEYMNDKLRTEKYQNSDNFIKISSMHVAHHKQFYKKHRSKKL